jgi:hypothetical protein
MSMSSRRITTSAAGPDTPQSRKRTYGGGEERVESGQGLLEAGDARPGLGPESRRGRCLSQACWTGQSRCADGEVHQVLGVRKATGKRSLCNAQQGSRGVRPLPESVWVSCNLTAAAASPNKMARVATSRSKTASFCILFGKVHFCARNAKQLA